MDYVLSVKYSVSIVLMFIVADIYANYTDIDLPADHVKYYLNAFPTVAEGCRNDTACPYKVTLGTINNAIVKESSNPRRARINRRIFLLKKLRIVLIPKLAGVTSRIAKPKILSPFLNVQVTTGDG